MVLLWVSAGPGAHTQCLLGALSMWQRHATACGMRSLQIPQACKQRMQMDPHATRGG